MKILAVMLPPRGEAENLENKTQASTGLFYRGGIGLSMVLVIFIDVVCGVPHLNEIFTSLLVIYLVVMSVSCETNTQRISVIKTKATTEINLPQKLSNSIETVHLVIFHNNTRFSSAMCDFIEINERVLSDVIVPYNFVAAGLFLFVSCFL